MSANNIIPFSFEDHDIRVIDVDGDPWFVAADVCAALCISDPSMAISRLDEDEKGTSIIGTPRGGGQNMLIVNEPGLYALIFTSRKPEAKRFRRWVKREVLPSIRKTGEYSITPRVEDAQFGWIRPVIESLHRLSLKHDKGIDAINGDMAQTRCLVRSVESKTDAIHGEVVELKQKIHRLELTTSKKRTEIPKKVQDQLIYQLGQLGGRCPCCGVTPLVDAVGRKTSECEFDHYSSNQRSTADYVWPICRSCHSELTNHKSHRIIDAGSHFSSFQQRRKKLIPGLFSN